MTIDSPSTPISDPDTPILIVDDNQQFATVLQRILQSVFFYSNITSVDSTEKAYSLLRADPGRFRVLFVDYRFPSGMNGVELLQRLAAEKLLQGKAGFLITSEPNLKNFKEALGAGVVGVVAKPFDREDLRRQLEKAGRSLQDIESF